MEAAISIDAFCARPVNHWVAAGSAVVWCASEDLCGCAFFGTPDLLDAAETVRAFEAIHDAELGPVSAWFSMPAASRRSRAWWCRSLWSGWAAIAASF